MFDLLIDSYFYISKMIINHFVNIVLKILTILLNLVQIDPIVINLTWIAIFKPM